MSDERSNLVRDPRHRREFEKLLQLAARRGDADLVYFFLFRFAAVSPAARPLRFRRLISFFGLRSAGTLSCSKSARSFKRPLAALLTRRSSSEISGTFIPFQTTTRRR